MLTRHLDSFRWGVADEKQPLHRAGERWPDGAYGAEIETVEIETVEIETFAYAGDALEKTATRRFYRLQAGDTTAEVAAFFDVAVERLEGERSDREPGSWLQLPVD